MGGIHQEQGILTFYFTNIHTIMVILIISSSLQWNLPVSVRLLVFALERLWRLLGLLLCRLWLSLDSLM